MACSPKTDIACVLLAIAYNGGEATHGEIIKGIPADKWKRVWVMEMGFDSPIALIVQNIASRTRRLVNDGILIRVNPGVSSTSSGARFRFARPGDLEEIERELKALCDVTDDERQQIEALSRDAEVKIDLFVGEVQTKWGQPHIEAAVILTSNKGRAEHGFWVNRDTRFSWVEEIDRMLTEA